MAKKSVLLVGAALAASSLQALASTPEAPSTPDPTALRAVAAPTGLTAADLIVGRNGAVAIEVSAKGIAVAENSNVNNTGC
jgi:hypothetical protein